MTTATSPVLAVADLTELLQARGYRIMVRLHDVFIGERDVLGVRQAMRRVVGQRNDDGSLRIAYIFARAGYEGGPMYQNDVVARDPACRDVGSFALWIAKQDARALTPEATS